MKRFSYKNPKAIADAVSNLEKGNSSVLAGGTDILNLLKIGALSNPPETLVNIKNIPGMDSISDDGQGLTIGALVKLSDITDSPVVREKYSILAEAAGAVSTPTLRGMGTIAGNICQEVQCWYFRRSFMTGSYFDCMKKGGKKCYAVTAENRYHSIFGGACVNDTPCSQRCPAGVDISSYMSKVREGNLAEAGRILIKSNPFPAITGRVCPHFCENGCNRCDLDEPVSISKCVERFIGDYVLEHADEMAKSPQAETGKSVAVVGSGPAGLAAAYYLRMLGHRVTVFETMPVTGGMLALTIPNYRLPGDVLSKEIDFIRATGVEIKPNSPIGKEITIAGLLQESYQAAFIAIGAQEGRKLRIPGAELKGTFTGLDFLRDVKMGEEVKLGRRVLVIGGGSVSFDCARVALRMGAHEVHLACLESRETMPADPSEILEGEEEGVVIHPSQTFTRIIDNDGKIRAVECLDVASLKIHQDGRMEIESVPASEHLIEADTVIFAIGQAPDLSVITGTEGLKITKRNMIDVDPDTLATSVKGIFSGGDAAITAGSVIKAIAYGKKAAESIDRYLGGAGLCEKPEDRHSAAPFKRFSTSCLLKTKRVTPPILPVSERIKSLDAEVVGGFSLSEVEAEADRCLNCGCVAVNSSDIAPALIALNAQIKTTKRVIEADSFFTAESSKTTVLDPGEIVVDIHIPAPRPGTKQTFTKFALRPTVDFSIVSVATAITKEAGRVSNARIVLGAVAPMPYRAVGAEEVLKGKAIDESVAEEAATASVKDAIPLVGNKHKAQIVRTLVKRAILA
jgi:NADPH-dependent glutamate synthase beta subunit-like oxidoreductase